MSDKPETPTPKPVDLHAQKAMELFGVTADQVTPKQRRFAKMANHSAVYGMTGAQMEVAIQATAQRRSIDLVSIEASMAALGLRRADNIGKQVSWLEDRMIAGMRAQVVSEIPKLEELFPFEYFSCGYFSCGYFRRKGVPKGTPADILHGQQAIEWLYAEIIKALTPEQEAKTESL